MDERNICRLLLHIQVVYSEIYRLNKRGCTNSVDRARQNHQSDDRVSENSRDLRHIKKFMINLFN